MSDIIVLICFIAVIIGIKSPIYGFITGMLVSIGYCYLGQTVGIFSWILLPLLGALLGFVFPYSVRWFFSGLKGGRGKNEPGTKYIGGFGVGREGQYFGKWADGIIPSDNEETGWVENKQERRERNIGILIRYLSAPIILLLAFIAFSLLR